MELEPLDRGLNRGEAVLDMISWPGLGSSRELAATLQLK